MRNYFKEKSNGIKSSVAETIDKRSHRENTLIANKYGDGTSM